MKIEKIDQLFRSNRSALFSEINRDRSIRTVLPIFIALIFIMGLVFHARLSDIQTPLARNGVLDLSEWNGKKVFELTGQWEFYWDKLLTDKEIKTGSYVPVIADAPDKWNNYEIGGISLPGRGKATYRINISGAEEGMRYGVRIQDLASVYRLYIDGELIAQNGSFGDVETAPAFAYRPQLASFTPTKSSFDIVLQVSNDIYGMGGMWEPVVFGTYNQVAAFDRLLSKVVESAMASLVVACMFFLIFFAAQRGEKDTLILSVLGVIVMMRLAIVGDVTVTILFPNIPIAWLSLIDFLAMPWAQFFLLYFIYCTYGNLVQRWQVAVLLAYTIAISFFVLMLPFHMITSAYMLMNYVLLIVIAEVTVKLMRATWQGREGAPLLLFAVSFLLLMILYKLFLKDRSIGYYLLIKSGFEYIVFVFAHMAVVALRYRRAQRLEIEHLKGQIRPHFIHNSLTSIISISRSEPEYARELLVDFSSYLRGFYDYERDELVPFAQELELVNAYVALEQARFGEKLHVEYKTDIDDFLLPSLILQPLVENAFVHGLREKEDGGTVTVYSKLIKNRKVRVGVRDDGVGFSVKSDPVRRGVGIENINRRLTRLYRTSLVYTVPEGSGCEVYFEIPYMEAQKHEDMVN